MKKGSANHATSANAASSVNAAASAKAVSSASCNIVATSTTCDNAAASDTSTFATVCANPTTEPGLYAAIDCGTVTVRMLVARIETSQYLRVLHRAYAIVNVGEHVDATRCISNAALQRLSATLHDFRTQLSAYEQQEHERARVRACATSAARDASNKDDLCRVFREAGFELDIISGDEEARLSFAGACAGWQALPASRDAAVAQQALLVVDIGGGSTELIAGMPGSAPCYVHSFDIGCRRATEKVLGSERISLASLERLNAWIDELMSPYFEQLYRDERFYPDACEQERSAHVNAPAPAPVSVSVAPAQHPVPCFPLLGVAGAATSAVSMLCSMHHYDAARVHGFPVSEANVAALIYELANMTLEQRKQRVGLEPKRASVIVAGLAIMQRIMYHTHHTCYYACESDVLQGVIFTLASNSCRYNRNCLVQ
ncbi:Ppx/GppA phosphatase family protein [Umbribacter vaginalis]|nr:Ppx/GppA phosphatase family protein [Coriobacteriales bacterium DNF00809]